MSFRKRIYEIVEAARPGDRLSQAFDVAIVALIMVNIVALMLESLDAVYTQAPGAFRGLELFSVAVFTAEYVLRLWSCTAEARFSRPIAGRIRYALTPLVIVDFLAIAPFFLMGLVAGPAALDLRSLRILRCFRIFRIAKLARYSEALQHFHRVLLDKREELIASFLFMLTLLLVTSSLMYYAERDAQPEKFASIFHAMWWSIATLTTVGYGDVYPATALGRLLAAGVAMLGIGMFALPTSILGAGFLESCERRRAGGRRCPHCGQPLDGQEQQLSASSTDAR